MKKALRVAAGCVVVSCIAVLLLGCPATTPTPVSVPDVTQLKPVKVADRSVTLTWVDPAGGTIASVEITFASKFGSMASPSPKSVPVGTQTVTVDTLPSNNICYIFTAKAVDAAGNRSPGVSTRNYDFLVPGLVKRTDHYSGVPPSGTYNGYNEYTYDTTTGMVSTLIEYNKNAVQTTKTDFQYTRGDVLSTKQINSHWDGTAGAWVLDSSKVQTYDSSGGALDGTIQKEENFDLNAALIGYAVFNWDSTGTETGWTNYDATGVLTSTTSWTCTSVLARSKNFNPDGSLSLTVDSNYDLISGLNTTYTTSNTAGYPVYQEAYQYSPTGNLTRKDYLNATQPSPPAQAVPLVQYAYDGYTY